MNNQLKKGFLYTALGTYSNFFLQLIIQMVLSRLLTPKDYGVVAIMQVFIVFFAMLIESGMGPAIIQNKTLTDKDNRVLFNFSAIFAIVIAVFFGLFGYLLSWIYGNSIYQALTWIQAISVLFNGLNIVPTALLNKEKQFKLVNISIVSGNLVAGIVGVTLAFLGAGVYSLIISAIISAVITFSLNRFFTKISFNRSWDTKALKQIWNFSKNQFGFNFINYFSRNSDNILIGKFMGAAPLANYNKAYQLLLLPNSLFLGVVNPVLQPVLSEFQDEPEKIKEVYYKIIHLLALLGMPLSVFLSLMSKQIIFFMFGTQWQMAVFPFSVLALTVWVQLTGSTTGSIFQARNHAKRLFFTGSVSAVILVSSIIIGIILGNVNRVALSLSLGFMVNFFWSFYQLIVKSLEDKMMEFLKEFIFPFFLAVIMFGILKLIALLSISNIFLSLIVNGLVFLAVMALFIAVTPERKYIKMTVRKE